MVKRSKNGWRFVGSDAVSTVFLPYHFSRVLFASEFNTNFAAAATRNMNFWENNFKSMRKINNKFTKSWKFSDNSHKKLCLLSEKTRKFWKQIPAHNHALTISHLLRISLACKSDYSEKQLYLDLFIYELEQYFSQTIRPPASTPFAFAIYNGPNMPLKYATSWKLSQ